MKGKILIEIVLKPVSTDIHSIASFYAQGEVGLVCIIAINVSIYRYI